MNKGGRTREHRKNELMLYIVLNPTERKVSFLSAMFKVDEITVRNVMAELGVNQSKKPFNYVG